jgi:predicted DNA-binding protein
MMDKEILKYNIEDFSGIESMEDFYTVAGLMDRIRNKELTQFDIHMNRLECEILNDFSKKNNRKSKKKKWSERMIDNSVAMDWLNYSPSSDNAQVPEGELWIYKED